MLSRLSLAASRCSAQLPGSSLLGHRAASCLLSRPQTSSSFSLPKALAPSRSLSLFNFGRIPESVIRPDNPDEQIEESPSLGIIDLSSFSSIEVHHDLDTLQQLYPKPDAEIAMEHVSQLWSVLKVEEIMTYIHTTFGVPWWGTICLMTLSLRTLIMPYTIFLLRNSMRMEKIVPTLKTLRKVMNSGQDPTGILDSHPQALPADHVSKHVESALPSNIDPVRLEKKKRRVRAAYLHERILRTNECHPLRNLIVPCLFPPLVLSVFGAVHNLSIAEPSMETGGMLWFKDLVAADPTFVLPTLSGLLWLWVVECAAGVHYFAWPNVRITSRAIALAFIPVTSTLPAGIFVFWITSNIYAIIQTYILRLESVRRFLRIPLSREVNYKELLPEKKPLY